MGRLLLAIAFIAFISLGLPDGLLGVAWPSMRANFGVSLDAMGALLAALVAGYVLSTTFSGAVVTRLGIGRLLAASSTLTAVALIGYTLAPAWPVALALGVLAGIGGGAIDAGINNYIAYRQRSQLYLLHAMFGVGTTIGPLIMTAALNVATWRAGYLLVGGFQLVLAFIFLLTAERWRIDGEGDAAEADGAAAEATLLQTLRLPMAWGGIFFFLFYTGIEISVGQWSYTLLTAGRDVPENLAGIVVGAYWGAFTVGRLLSGWIARRVPETTFLRASFGLVIGGTLLVWWNPATAVSLIALPLTGFGLAPLFPALVGSTAERVAARHRANTIGFQIGAAAVGGAVLPGLAGGLTRLFGLEAITAVHVIAALLLALLHEILLWGTRRRRAERGS